MSRTPKARSANAMTSMVEIPSARSDYHMANRQNAQTRRRKGVPRSGAGADYHYRDEGDWLWMSELAWDMHRNNMALGSITDRAVEQTLQGGFKYDPDTGDKRLDADLKEWWKEVCEDPKECDPGMENVFADQEEIALRATLVAGDILGVPHIDGAMDVREGHMLRSPSSKNTRERIVHGVEYVPDSRRRAAYWLLKDVINPRKTTAILKKDLEPIAAWTDDGERNVLHMRFPKRVNQTRGLTAYAPLFDIAGYHDDVQFLKMVQARAASLFVFVRSRSENFDPDYLAAEMTPGIDVSVDKAEQYELNKRQYKEVAAASVLEGLPGETIDPWSTNIPNPEFFPHAKLLLTLIGINLGMPLVMALMDASQTNFSGYRGAVDQARMNFRLNQRRMIRRWHTPYMRFKLFKKAETDVAFRRRLERSINPNINSKVNVFKHTWTPPSWPYLEPTKDATGDLIRDANMLTSPRRRCQERGYEWNEIFRETVEDRSAAMRLALGEAQKIKDEFALETDIDTIAMRLAPMPTADKTNISIQTGMDSSPAQPVTDGSEA